jgi:hypothetical protein
MDFEVERCTRRCAISGRELAEGEEFFSAIVSHAGKVERRDYAVQAWPGPPEGSLAHWKSRMPNREVKKNQLAPSEVLLQLFNALESAADQQDMRYVLALLMIRRRIFRLEETLVENGRELLVLYSPRDEGTYRTPVVLPDLVRADEIQAELSRLLFSSGEATTPVKQDGMH